MPARDLYHGCVRRALIAEGWTITHDPYTITYGTDNVYADLGAEQALAAERGTERIAVEIKSFLGASGLRDLEQALGQYLVYRSLMARVDPLRKLFLAVPIEAYQATFRRPIAEPPVEDEGRSINIRPDPRGDLPMDTVSDYRRVIRRLIEGYAAVRPSIGDIQIETIFDEANDHYELIYSGWDGQRRIHGSVVHADIRDGKVWIQHDGTYDGMANDLVEAGVPHDRIILAYKSPGVRQYTGFATA